MSNFLCFTLVTALVYLFSLVGIGYANSKSKKVRTCLVCLIILAFSVWNGWAMSANNDKVPISSVEKAWGEYTNYCKEEHISWNELPFPEWLVAEASK